MKINISSKHLVYYLPNLFFVQVCKVFNWCDLVHGRCVWMCSWVQGCVHIHTNMCGMCRGEHQHVVVLLKKIILNPLQIVLYFLIHHYLYSLNFLTKIKETITPSNNEYFFIQVFVIITLLCILIRDILQKVVLDANDLLNNMKLKTPFLSFLSNYQAYAYALHSIVTKEHVEQWPHLFYHFYLIIKQKNFYVILSQKKNTYVEVCILDFE